MPRPLAELLILVPTALGAGCLLFIATVLQKVMNSMDEPAFRRFVPLLVHTATHDVYTVVASTVTLVAAVPYLVFYGFGRGWFVAGLALFVVSSVAGKVLNLPAYARIAALQERDAAQLRAERAKLQTANWVRALLSAAAVASMVIQFI